MVKMNNDGVIKFISSITTDYIYALSLSIFCLMKKWII